MPGCVELRAPPPPLTPALSALVGTRLVIDLRLRGVQSLGAFHALTGQVGTWSRVASFFVKNEGWAFSPTCLLAPNLHITVNSKIFGNTLLSWCDLLCRADIFVFFHPHFGQCHCILGGGSCPLSPRGGHRGALTQALQVQSLRDFYSVIDDCQLVHSRVGTSGNMMKFSRVSDIFCPI